MRNSVFGVRFSHLSKSNLVAVLLGRHVPPESGPKLIVTANVDHVVNLRRVTQFRDAYDFAWLIVADGAPIYAYARLRGVPLIERITGADLFLDLVTQFDQRHRPFFVASTEEAAQRTLRKLEAAGQCSERFAHVVPPFGFEDDEAYSDFLVQRIAKHNTTHLFMCVGSPKSEIWAWRNRAGLGDLYVLGVGAALEFFAGTLARAPPLLRRLGLEWSWRLVSEPRRLARRYSVGFWLFLVAIVNDLAAAQVAEGG
jgi:N-acetylglucosaminyldiphosphoundecaprenol N-acetyl-beta-D-mannosaminyltransferase